MENELTFRTAVGGYRKDEVMEYVENLNDEMFRMKKEYEDECVRLRLRVQELESQLQEEQTKSSMIIGEQQERIQVLEEENSNLKGSLNSTSEELEGLKIRNKATEEELEREKGDKQNIKEKLAKEVLRLRAENRVLRENWKDAEKRAGCKEDYEAVREVISEVQFKITEYVNIINKTQEKLGDTYQQMNGIKKKVAEEIEKATKK